MYQPSGFTSATTMTQYRMIWNQPMAVMGSDLSNFLRTQEDGQEAEQRRAQQRIRQQELCEDHHGSEALRTQQGVGEVEQEAERDEAGERIIEDHRPLPLKPFTDIGVA